MSISNKGLQDLLLESYRKLFSVYDAYSAAVENPLLKEIVDRNKAKEKITELKSEVTSYELLLAKNKDVDMNNDVELLKFNCKDKETKHLNSLKSIERDQVKDEEVHRNEEALPTSSKRPAISADLNEDRLNLARYLASANSHLDWSRGGKRAINWAKFSQMNPKRTALQWKGWYAYHGRKQVIDELVAQLHSGIMV